VDVCSVVPSAWPGREEGMCEGAVNAAVGCYWVGGKKEARLVATGSKR